MYTLATNMAPKSTKNASDNMKKDARCSWTDADDAIIVRVLRNKKNRGTSQVPAGKVKSGVWTAAHWQYCCSKVG